MLGQRKNLLLVLAVLAIGLVGVVILFNQEPAEDSGSEFFITANPFDLNQIKGFSKYRSCQGHDYRHPGLDGQIESTPRSMKHYVVVKPEFRGTTDQVDVFAPFNGEISEVIKEGQSADSQVWLEPNSNRRQQWQFVFFHILLDPGLEIGSAVTAGQHIGTAALSRGPDGATDNFDIALKLMQPWRQPAIAPLFNYVNQAVMAEYAQYGLQASDLIVPAEYRDQHPCPLAASSDGPDASFPSGHRESDYVWLTAPDLK